MGSKIYRPATVAGARRSFAFAHWPSPWLLRGAAALFAGLVVTLVAASPSAADPASDAWMACTGPDLVLPLTVSIGPGVDARVVRAALAEWNALRPGAFVEVSGAATVSVVSSTRTWVDMPCGKTTSTVYAGSDVNLSYWMAHELGHSLRLADHVPVGSNPAGYRNPRFCPDSGYVGIMSYCTPRAQWWGEDDRRMMREAFPVTLPPEFEPRYRSFAGGLAR